MDGQFSGEEFREDVLMKHYQEFLKSPFVLKLVLDGTVGYGPSFLEESIGGLTRKIGKDAVLKFLRFSSLEEPFLIDEIEFYIDNNKKL